MYLHRLVPDPRHPRARKDMASRYEMHRTLARALATEHGVPPQDRYLWRVDVSRSDEASILVQTTEPVDWSPLERQHPGYCAAIQANKAVGALRFAAGELFHFRLHASPTRTFAGKRTGLLDESAQLEWASRMAGESGFELVACDRRRGYLERHRKPDGNEMVIAVAELEGVLRVLDEGKFKTAIRSGIGRGKAFGLGLLSLAPTASD